MSLLDVAPYRPLRYKSVDDAIGDSLAPRPEARSADVERALQSFAAADQAEQAWASSGSIGAARDTGGGAPYGPRLTRPTSDALAEYAAAAAPEARQMSAALPTDLQQIARAAYRGAPADLVRRALGGSLEAEAGTYIDDEGWPAPPDDPEMAKRWFMALRSRINEPGVEAVYAHAAQKSPESRAVQMAATAELIKEGGVSGRGPYAGMSMFDVAALGLALSTGGGSVGAARFLAGVFGPRLAQQYTADLPTPARLPADLGLNLAGAVYAAGAGPRAGRALTRAWLPTVPEQGAALFEPGLSPSQRAEAAIPLAMLAGPFLASRGIPATAEAVARVQAMAERPAVQRVLLRLNEEQGGGVFPGGENRQPRFDAEGNIIDEPTLPGALIDEVPPEAQRAAEGAVVADSAEMPPPAAPREAGAAKAIDQVSSTDVLDQGQPASPESPALRPQVLPTVNEKFIRIMQRAAISPGERARLIREGRARQAGGAASAALGQGSFAERQAAAGARMQGQILPDFEAIGAQFTPEELVSLEGQIDAALRNGEISSFQWKTAGNAYQRMIYGGREPQPAERKLLGRIFGPDFEQAIPRGPERWKLWNEIIGLLGIPQTLSTIADLSAFLRQSAVLGSSHAGAWLSSLKAGVDAAATEKGAMAIMDRVEANPWVKGVGELDGYGWREVGGYLSDLNPVGEAAEREGQFASLNRSRMSKLIQRIPGVRASERAFAVMLNKLRTDAYASEAQGMWNTGVRDVEQYKALAQVINHATGRGPGPVGQITQGVNAFFSPRNLTARFMVAIDPIRQPGSLLKPSARQLAAKNLVAFTAYNAGVLALLKYTGVYDRIGIDPLSADYGKGVINNTRVDLTAGYGSLMRTVARLAAGETTTATGEHIKVSRQKIVEDFLRSKLGPVPAALVDIGAGSNTVGEPADFTSAKGLRTQAFNRLTPFFAQDVVQAWRLSGPAIALGAAPAAFLGAGAQSYRQPSREARESIQGHGGDYKAAYLEALNKGDEDAANSIRSQWRKDYVKRVEPLGVTLIPGAYDEETGLARAPRLTFPDIERTAFNKGRSATDAHFGDLAKGAETMDDVEQAYVDQWTAYGVKEYGLTQSQARETAQKGWPKDRLVKQYAAAVKRATLAFWREHPDLLRESNELGVNELDEAERKILTDAAKDQR